MLHSQNSTTAIGNIVVETDSLLIANDVALHALKQDTVRGQFTIKNTSYRWSTLQQYNYHKGFTQ